MSEPKPFFRCPVQITRSPDGSLVFHITRRDGTVQIMPGPPGVTKATTNIEATQAAGSDDVQIVFVGH